MAGSWFDVCVIIPHYAGEQVLECLDAIGACPDRPAEVVLVDDACADGTSDLAAVHHPEVTLLRNPRNLGFVGACNRGLEHAVERGARYAFLLNDDALVEPGWLEHIVAAMERDTSVAAVQPKVMSVGKPGMFDYAGAAGGLMDRYGYPFALGRWFDECERDEGQYDTPRDIFWASGAAICMRVSVCRKIGLLDDLFQMHMEEIDWCWRAWIAGYRVRSVPAARVRHYGAATLTGESFRKQFLNHRNSVMMLLKNCGTARLLTDLPVRLALEAVTIAGALATGRWTRAAASFRGTLAALRMLPRLLPARRAIQGMRARSEDAVLRMTYPRSIAFRYLLHRGSPVRAESAGTHQAHEDARP